MAVCEYANSRVKSERDANILGEMVQCAERQNAHDVPCAGDFAGNCADCPVSAGGYDGLVIFVQSFANGSN